MNIEDYVRNFAFLLNKNCNTFIDAWTNYYILINNKGVVANIEYLIRLILYKEIEFSILSSSISLFNDISCSISVAESQLEPDIQASLSQMKNNYKSFFRQKKSVEIIGNFFFKGGFFLQKKTNTFFKKGITSRCNSSYKHFKFNDIISQNIDREMWVTQMIRSCFITSKYVYDDQYITDVYFIFGAALLNLYYSGITSEKSSFIFNLYKEVRELRKTPISFNPLH